MLFFVCIIISCYIVTIYFQILSQLPLSESLVMYQPILSSSYSFFSSRVLGKNTSVESLKKMLAVLLGLLADQKLSANGDEGQYTKVINGVCLRVLDRANFTNLNWLVTLTMTVPSFSFN